MQKQLAEATRKANMTFHWRRRLIQRQQPTKNADLVRQGVGPFKVENSELGHHDPSALVGVD
jgi:hypothetical protein